MSEVGSWTLGKRKIKKKIVIKTFAKLRVIEIIYAFCVLRFSFVVRVL